MVPRVRVVGEDLLRQPTAPCVRISRNGASSCLRTKSKTHDLSDRKTGTKPTRGEQNECLVHALEWVKVDPEFHSGSVQTIT
jgi:hypothetical protein